MTDTILTTNAEPVLTALQLAEVMDTSVGKVRRHISKFRGALKVKGRWIVPASTVHGLLFCFNPEGQEPSAVDIVFAWFPFTIQLGFPEEIPTPDWLIKKHRLIDVLSGCECGKT